MNKSKILGLSKVGEFIKSFLNNSPENYTEQEEDFALLLKRSEVENPWFDQDSLKYALTSWSELLTVEKLTEWLAQYPIKSEGKKIGLILAGNIPFVGWHDVISVLLSNNGVILKLSSKDRWIIPFFLKLWDEAMEEKLPYQIVERLEGFDAIIATGSNNTARYLEYYFKDYPAIIRKNRTSVAILNGAETEEQLKALADDIFVYYGLGCRNVTRLFLPQDMVLDRLFESFISYQDIINHNKYANNYDYNRAVYLLNQDQFWDNNFVMLKEDEKLFSPLSVVNFTRYNEINEVITFIDEHKEEIQALVANPNISIEESINFGEAQKPSLSTYADDVDTIEFLLSI